MSHPFSILFLGQQIPATRESENEGIEVYVQQAPLWIWVGTPEYFRYFTGPSKWVARIQLDPESLVCSVEAEGNSLEELEENAKKELRKLRDSCKLLLGEES